jgi:PKD repeat protein
MVFNALPLSFYDSLIQQYVSSGDWLDVLRVKRFSEIDGYDSPTIEQATQQALVNMPMLENLPLTWVYGGNSYYMVYHRFVLNAYRYAAQYGQTSKWNASAAYQELLVTYQAARQPSLAYNPITNTIFWWSPRYYDESAETLDSFVKLGGNDAGLWDYIQNHFWSGVIYSYLSGNNMYECEVGFFAMVIGYYYAMNGYNLANFDRVYLDLYNKLLAQDWSSVAWGVPGVLQHASGNPQLRLENTLGAIQALQAYCGSSTWQSSFANLLGGSTKAWTALTTSPLYSAGRFKFHSDDSFSDYGTATGMMTLFLEGILPDTGSLAMPLNDEGYQDILGLSPASLFGFDYVNRRIRIPVNPGVLKFQFGTGVASYTFPSVGVYEVQFDSSWNIITSVNEVGPLGSQFQYLTVDTFPPSPPKPPVANFDWSPSLPVTGESITFDASSSLPGWNGTQAMPIALYSWDFGDNSTTSGRIMTHTYSSPGNYTVTLNVTDSEGLTNSTSQTLTAYVAVTFDQTGIGSDFNGTVLTVDNNVCGVGDLPKTFLWNVGSNHTFVYQSPLVVSPGRKQYDWNSTSGLSTRQSDSITAISNAYVTGSYLTTSPDHLINDVAVTNITVYTIYDRMYVYQGMRANITVTIENTGDFPENANVTLYYNMTANKIVGTQNITILAGESETLLFVWNTANVPCCYTDYSLTAVVAIPVDYTLADNTLSDGKVRVKIMGDINGDGRVDITDVAMVSASFGSYIGPPPHLRWNLACDLDGDGKVDIIDHARVSANYGKSCPP